MIENTNIRERLDSEWITLNAVRELIRMASQGDSRKSSYDRALEFGAAICPEILGEDVSLIRQSRRSDTAREYVQKAEAKTKLEKKQYSPIDLLDSDLAEYKNLIDTARNRKDVDRLKRRLDEMKRAKAELSPLRSSENELIFRDAYNVVKAIPEIEKGKAHRDFHLGNDEVLRIRVFHPDNPEHVSGADVVYERHHPTNRTVSIAAIQYKIWEDQKLYLNDDRMKNQLSKMKGFFCDQETCVGGALDHPFRFPYCAAFLRPTDRLQTADQALASSGEHIPICQLNRVATKGAAGGDCITFDGIRAMSLSQEVFEGLFSTGKLGSRTLSYDELLKLYEGIRELSDPDRVVIHAQEFVSQ